MKREQWKPIKPDGNIDEAELRRPAETAEPTTWEVTIPPFPDPGFTAGRIPIAPWPMSPEQAGRHAYRKALCAIWAAAEYEDRHRFVLTVDVTEPQWSVSEWPANVTIVSTAITTQAEADAVLPALLSVKAARHEAVFAPTQAIDIERFLDPKEAESCIECGWDGAQFIRPEDFQWSEQGDLRCPECGHTSGMSSMTTALDAIRVRGGESPMHPAHVMALLDQAVGAGVTFSLAWGEWVPIESLQGLARRGTERRAIGEDFCYRVGADRSGCALDGVEYPEGA